MVASNGVLDRMDKTSRRSLCVNANVCRQVLRPSFVAVSMFVAQRCACVTFCRLPDNSSRLASEQVDRNKDCQQKEIVALTSF